MGRKKDMGRGRVVMSREKYINALWTVNTRERRDTKGRQ
jgi:hypothetical protein